MSNLKELGIQLSNYLNRVSKHVNEHRALSVTLFSSTGQFAGVLRRVDTAVKPLTRVDTAVKPLARVDTAVKPPRRLAEIGESDEEVSEFVENDSSTDDDDDVVLPLAAPKGTLNASTAATPATRKRVVFAEASVPAPAPPATLRRADLTWAAAPAPAPAPATVVTPATPGQTKTDQDIINDVKRELNWQTTRPAALLFVLNQLQKRKNQYLYTYARNHALAIGSAMGMTVESSMIISLIKGMWKHAKQTLANSDEMNRTYLTQRERKQLAKIFATLPDSTRVPNSRIAYLTAYNHMSRFPENNHLAFVNSPDFEQISRHAVRPLYQKERELEAILTSRPALDMSETNRKNAAALLRHIYENNDELWAYILKQTPQDCISYIDRRIKSNYNMSQIYSDMLKVASSPTVPFK